MYKENLFLGSLSLFYSLQQCPFAISPFESAHKYCSKIWEKVQKATYFGQVINSTYVDATIKWLARDPQSRVIHRGTGDFKALTVQISFYCGTRILQLPANFCVVARRSEPHSLPVQQEIMILFFLVNTNRSNQIVRVNQKLCAFESTAKFCSASQSDAVVERISRIINDHPFPDKQLQTTLHREIPQEALTTSFVEQVLGHLFGAHSNGLKAYQFFRISLLHSQYHPSSDAFEKTLHILTRMRYFDSAWELMESIKQRHPSLLTKKSMGIMLSRIAKFQSFEETIEAFERMEKYIFSGKEFGVEEFNILLRAFCTQRQMKEARSVFNKFHPRFSPNTKTMNILLLGFKESGDVTAVELFYHELVRRGFKPNNVTYNIRIDAYCKKGCFGDALRLFEEMKQIDLLPTTETITTLIHGAGIARNVIKARELFDKISSGGLHADVGAYNAFMSSLIMCRDTKSASALMNEMEEKNIQLDNVTYHTMFWGLIRSKSIIAVSELYQKMIGRMFVPKARTVVTLMKFFCENSRLDLGLNLWSYVVKNGHCPHSHALDILVTGLCSRGRIQEAFECSKQLLERGRNISDLAYSMLERYLLQTGEMDSLQNLDKLRKRLQAILPPPGAHTVGSF